jgi:hypothetical protein
MAGNPVECTDRYSLSDSPPSPTESEADIHEIFLPWRPTKFVALPASKRSGR